MRINRRITIVTITRAMLYHASVTCLRCQDEGWICEAHPDQPWPRDDCAGPGELCPVCNTSEPPRTGFDISIARVDHDDD